MISLNFPKYSFQVKKIEEKTYIFDSIRKKYLVLTPEEWVRQHIIHFLIEEKKVPKTLLNVEKKIKIGSVTKRYDIIVFYPNGKIFLIVECKAMHIPISQEVFDQIARYNLVLNADYLMVSNGLNNYYCQMDFQKECYVFLRDLPDYSFKKV